MKIIELKYSNTNTYLIRGSRGTLLFDTGWAGTFPAFCRAMGEMGVPVQAIDYVLVSHFHPDHYGIAQEIVDVGPVIAVVDLQKPFIHASDPVFAKEGNRAFRPVDDASVRIVSLDAGRDFLDEMGIDGEIIHTPGHSDDSISLLLDDGSLFVGDLNPLYELSMHEGTEIDRTWEMLLARRPRRVYYGHARSVEPDLGDAASGEAVGQSPGGKADMDDATSDEAGGISPGGKAGVDGAASGSSGNADMAHLQPLTERIMKYVDRGFPIAKIVKKTGADASFVEDVTRMYLTHTGVSVQGILDRIEIKGR